MDEIDKELEKMREVHGEPPLKVVVQINEDGVRIKKPKGVIVAIEKRSTKIEGWEVKTLPFDQEFNNTKPQIT